MIHCHMHTQSQSVQGMINQLALDFDLGMIQDQRQSYLGHCISSAGLAVGLS